MKRATNSFHTLVILAVALALCLAAALFAQPALAQSDGSTTDSACRNCHSGSTHEYQFPSGETTVVGLEMSTLDASPHSAYGSDPVYCTDCHAGSAGRYRYPHDANPAETQREFALEVSDNCEQCHYAHKPFHPIEGSDPSELEGDLPVCSDCHGSHNIARVDAMAQEMPGRCLQCHTDQDGQWAALFLEPRPGLGVGAEGYAGSTRCNGCHDDLYFTWHDTLHAQFIQDASANPSAVLADFNAEGLDLTATAEDVAYTIGNRWRQAYLVPQSSDTPTRTSPIDLELLPMQWLVADQQWAVLEEGGERPAGWITECGSCHVTGLDTDTWGFTEFGIGCEGCHGPAAAHAADPLNVKPFAEVDDQVCGACHSRGVSPDGHPFPASYQPGEELGDHFTLSASSAALWPDGSAKYNHQQYMDWQLGNTMALDDVNCVTCHSVHNVGAAQGQVQVELNELCVQCHGEQESLGRHTPFHQKAITERDFLCTECHMPRMASSAEPFDLHSHSFSQPDPELSLVHGGIEEMPNACNLCHTAQAETAEWAAQTIAHAKSLAPEASFFGPGPTPTSPPPPTPMPSVGQLATVELTPPFWWVRWGAWGLGGLLLLGGLGWLGWKFGSRRISNG